MHSGDLPLKGSRAASLALLLAGCAPVLLDSVVPPAGIPLSVLAIWLILRWQGQTLAVVGVRRPEMGWGRALLLGVAGAGVLLAMSAWVYPWMRGPLGIPPQDQSGYAVVVGNHRMLAIFLGVSWTTAGFGEELIFRGFLMSGLARVLGAGRGAWIMALVVANVLFGFLHWKTGWGGVLDTGLTGAILGGIFLLARRSIWAAYVAHALTNTIGFLLIYLGHY